VRDASYERWTSERLRCVWALGRRRPDAWLPLFAGALLERTDAIDLAAPFDELSSTTGLVVLGVLTTAGFVGDKIPAVDHVLHLLGTVIAPLSGAALVAGQTGADTDIPTLVAAIAGGALRKRSTPAARRSGRPRRRRPEVSAIRSSR
jgi:Domain of unknown function (DUF4126)